MSAEKEKTADSPPSGKGKRKLSRGKQLGLGVVILVIALAAMNSTIRREVSTLFIVANQEPIEIDQHIVNALATDGLSAMAVVHSDNTAKLKYSVFNQLKSIGLPPEQSTKSPIVGVLMNTGLGLIESLQSASVGLYLNDENNVDYAMVLTGDFTETAIQAFIQDNFNVEQSTAESVRFNYIDTETCKGSDYYRARIEKDRIVLATDNRFDEVIDRLDNQVGSLIDLTGWLEFSKDHVISSILLMPEQLGKITNTPMLNQIANSIIQNSKEVKSVYVGATVTAMPAAIKVVAQLNTNNDIDTQNLLNAINAVTDNQDNNWLRHFNSVRGILNNSTLSQQDNQISLKTTISNEVLFGFETLPVELIAYATDGAMDFDIIEMSGRQVFKDAIDRTTYEYQQDVRLDKLSDYNPQAAFASAADVVTGPFGVSLERLSFEQAKPGKAIKALTVKAEAQDLPNAAKDKHYAALRVTSVIDRNEKEMLQKNACGPHQYNRPIWFNSKGGKGDSTTASNTVRLMDSADMGSIKQIKGEIDVRVPRGTKNYSIKNEKGQHMTVADAAFEITQHGPGYTAYRISGDVSNIIEIRGLNAEGKPLKKIMAEEKPYALGYGLSGKASFNGSVEKIELITATKMVTSTYAYILDQSTPTVGVDQLAQNTTRYYNYNIDAFVTKFTQAPRLPMDLNTSLGSTVAGPFNVSVRNARTSNALNTTFDIYAPADAYNLERNLSSVSLRLDSFVLTDQSAFVPGQQEVWSKPLFLSNRTDSLYDSVKITTGQKIRADDVVNVLGVVKVRMANNYELFTWDNLSTGETLALGDGLAMTIVSVSRGGILLKAEGDASRIVVVKPLNKDEKEIWVTAMEANYQPGWELDLKMQGDAQKLAILVADGITEHEYPFSIRLQ